MERLDNYLLSKTYLVGECLTLADVAMALEIGPILRMSRGQHCRNLKRWYDTVANQKFVQEVLTGSKLLSSNGPGPTTTAKSDKKPKSSNKAKKSEAPKEEAKKLRILCLHGYRQSGPAFKNKLGAFRKTVGKRADLVFMTAPLIVPPLNSEEDGTEDGYGWWFSSKSRSFEAHATSDCDDGFEQSLEAIKAANEAEGPFDGILAFSQGAALLVILCLMQAQGKILDKIGFEFGFAIMVAPFKSRSCQHDCWFEGPRVRIPTLLVIGDDDKVIEREMSDAILDRFQEPMVLRHPGGHFVPATGKQKQVYLDFLKSVS